MRQARVLADKRLNLLQIAPLRRLVDFLYRVHLLFQCQILVSHACSVTTARIQVLYITIVTLQA